MLKVKDFKEIAAGLRFPEGPVALPDGDLLVVEVAAGTLTRIRMDGRCEVVAELGGGPNGAAIGPDGKCYVCNNGGIEFKERDGRWYPGVQAAGYTGGRIERVDLSNGAVEVLYESCEGMPLRSPNDLVFDRHGGFWFTDTGKTRRYDRDRGAIYYALADGSSIRRAFDPLETPNGIGLSPDQKSLYVAETGPARVWRFDLERPGEIARSPKAPLHRRGWLLAGLGGYQHLDSLAVDSEGWVCVATIIRGGITAIDAEGRAVEHIELPDPITTNICFGGDGLQTAFVTLGSTGKLISMRWPRAGLALNCGQ